MIKPNVIFQLFRKKHDTPPLQFSLVRWNRKVYQLVIEHMEDAIAFTCISKSPTNNARCHRLHLLTKSSTSNSTTAFFNKRVPWQCSYLHDLNIILYNYIFAFLSIRSVHKQVSCSNLNKFQAREIIRHRWVLGVCFG